MRRLVCLCALAAACSRDLNLPDPAANGAGTISGRCVIAVPGRSERQPVKGAKVSLLSSTAGAETNDLGIFVVEGITSSSGSLLFRYDTNGDGQPDLQKLVRLEDIGAGPKRSLNMGDVLLVESSRLHGRALGADRVNQRGGHGGTVIFVPEGPYTTYTNDDGTYALDELPAGDIQLSAFRVGYTNGSLTGISLRSGEDLAVRDIILEQQVGTPAPGAIVGRLQFVPSTDAIGATVIAKSVLDGTAFNGTVKDDGAFEVRPLPPGVYDVRASRPDYTTTTAPNVVVQSMKDSVVLITVGQGPANDPNRNPPDAGAPPDAGSPDAGGSATPCTSTAECPFTEWCDDGLCRPQCASSAQCTNGRICETVTRTCVRPCGTGCPSGTSCDTATNACRTFCDGAFPCGAGFRCVASQCVPECALPADCPQFFGCQAGTCVRGNGCAIDRDCRLESLCANGMCVARPTAFVDGGALDGGSGFACSNACQCKMGEVCLGSVCVADVYVPDRFVAADGGGLGLTPSTAAGSIAQVLTPDASVTVALQAGDVLDSGVLVIGAPGVALVGGYVSCGTERWVRDAQKSTTLFTPQLTAVQVPGTLTRKLTDVTLEGLDFAPAVACPANGRVIEAGFADRLKLSRVRVSAARSGNCGGVQAVAALTESLNVSVSGLQLLPSVAMVELALVQVSGGSGVIERVSAVQQNQGVLSLVRIDQNDGPVTVRGIDQPELALNSSSSNVDRYIQVTNCGAPVTVRDNRIQFPNHLSPGNFTTSLIGVSGCPGVSVINNHLDGIGQGVAFSTVGAPAFAGMYFQDSTGVISGNTVDFPRDTTATQAAFSGIWLAGPRASFTVDDNHITATQSPAIWHGLHIDQVTLSGQLAIRNLSIDGGTNTNSTNFCAGIYAINVSGVAGLSITDVDVRAPVLVGGNCTSAFVGIALVTSIARVERAKVIAPPGMNPFALVVDNSQAEVYSSFFSVGANSCATTSNGTGGSSTAMSVIGGANAYFAGNSGEVNADPLQAGNSCALRCEAPATLVATGNIFGGGAGPDHAMVCNSGSNSCTGVTQNFTSNYFWYSRPGPRTANERVQFTTPSDSGVPDVRGNIVGETVDPYGGAPQPTYVLSANSPCLDRLDAGVRRDGGVLELDIEGRPRPNGAAMDIGAYER